MRDITRGAFGFSILRAGDLTITVSQLPKYRCVGIVKHVQDLRRHGVKPEFEDAGWWVMCHDDLRQW